MYKFVMRFYFCGVFGVFLVFDFICKFIFMYVIDWFNDFCQIVEFDIVVVFVGNKVDLVLLEVEGGQNKCEVLW